MKKIIPLLIFSLMFSIVLAKSGTLEVITHFIGNMSIPSRADAGNVELNEKFEWYIITVNSPTIPFEVFWLNGTNIEGMDTYIETPDGKKIKLPVDYTDRVIIEESEVGNYTVYSRGDNIGESKGFIRAVCEHCDIIDLGRWVREE